MVEEFLGASRTVPRMMLTTILINGLLEFMIGITLAFCVRGLRSSSY